ncbi:FtsX-like permease family protein [Salinibacter altiplanensis]|uniref:FtsX-like permease family protein n=1 Tax=Salinibacter altiplanensis TaxID=1803181 RepID=UPI000C9FD33B|nr:FtsX-like permease family protein [Salinibacter altiplanensis]
MIENYLKVAWRTLRKHPVYATVNVFGLGIALATCLLIGLYVQDELSYDTFHPQADRVLSVVLENEFSDRPQRIGPAPFATILSTKIPGVEHATFTNPTGAKPVHPVEGRKVTPKEGRVLKADSSFFNVFSGFPVRRADRDDVLDAPGEAVLTASMTEALFGDESPIGRGIQVEGDRYTIVGLTEVPDRSTLQFDLVVSTPDVLNRSGSWGRFVGRTYARMGSAAPTDSVATTLEKAIPEEMGRFVQDVWTIPLSDLYLSDAYEADRFKGEPRYLYLFGTVALLILFIAGFNYANLSIAQADRRTGEVGIRRTMGAQREQLVGQFFGETILVALLAYGLGAVLAATALPAFNALFEKELALAAPRAGGILAGGLVVMLLASGLAGAYPAYILSGFRPARTLRSASQTTVGGGGWLQKGLVVAQFAVSAGLVFGTIVVYQQLEYLQTKDLGFDEERVVTVNLDSLGTDRRRALRERALHHPGVKHATIGSQVPGGIQSSIEQDLTDLSDSVRAQDRKVLIRPVEVDTNYVSTLEMEMIAGQGFAEVSPAQRRNGYLLTETTVETFGWTPETAVGKPFGFSKPGTVLGVVEDFHVESLRTPIAPVVLAASEGYDSPFSSRSVLAARLASDRVEAGLDHLRQVTQEAVAGSSFSYTFLDDRFDQMYRSERRLGRIFVGFAGIAIALACMGLFGLASYAVQRRRQELGIRKALGATGKSILSLLSGEYGLLLGIAFLLGTPLAYWGVRQWLREFAYRTDVGGGAFALTAGLVLLVAGVSISYHALRAVRTDPARVLRSE